MRAEYQESSRLFLSSIECPDSNYKDFGIAMFKLCVKCCMREYSCRV
jgi:hypothetical protein